MAANPRQRRNRASPPRASSNSSTPRQRTGLLRVVSAPSSPTRLFGPAQAYPHSDRAAGSRSPRSSTLTGRRSDPRSSGGLGMSPPGPRPVPLVPGRAQPDAGLLTIQVDPGVVAVALG